MFRALFLVPKRRKKKEHGKNAKKKLNIGLFVMLHRIHRVFGMSELKYHVDGWMNFVIKYLLETCSATPNILSLLWSYSVFRYDVRTLSPQNRSAYSYFGCGLILFQFFDWNILFFSLSCFCWSIKLQFFFCCRSNTTQLSNEHFCFIFINEAYYLVCFLAYWWDAWVSVGCRLALWSWEIINIFAHNI